MNYILALLTAALLILTFPAFNISWLAAFAVAPLLVACARESRPWRRSLLGWISGVAYWWGVCYWIQFTLAVHGGMSEAGAWTLFALFCFTKALHMAVFALAAGVLMRRWWAAPAVAALWVAIEWSHTWLGFAWLALGNAGIDMSVPLRLAPYTGVYGVSFVFMLMNATLALAVLRRPRMEYAWILALLPLVMLPRLPEQRRVQQTAVLAQPNISETAEWTQPQLEAAVRSLVQLSRETARTGAPPSIIAWPEVPAPFYYYADPQFRSAVDSLAKQTGAYVLTGTVAFTREGAPLNSAVLVSPAGELVTRYDKVNLVPFGEFVPWPFGAVTQKISAEAGDFAPGRKVVVSQAGAHKLGTFICYESVFPNFVRQFAAEGAGVLFNISNDGYFGKSAARLQHLAIVRMRAVENRRWILRVTNDGVTAGIDPAGRIGGRVPPYIEAATRTGFNYENGMTVYTRAGDWFVWLCIAAAGVSLGAALRRGQPCRMTSTSPSLTT